MQNEFEKQVRQTVESLNLEPAPPVWNHIAREINKKKERRRFIFWFFICSAGLVFVFFPHRSGLPFSKSVNVSLEKHVIHQLKTNIDKKENDKENATLTTTQAYHKDSFYHEPSVSLKTKLPIKKSQDQSPANFRAEKVAQDHFHEPADLQKVNQKIKTQKGFLKRTIITSYLFKESKASEVSRVRPAQQKPFDSKHDQDGITSLTPDVENKKSEVKVLYKKTDSIQQPAQVPKVDTLLKTAVNQPQPSLPSSRKKAWQMAWTVGGGYSGVFSVQSNSNYYNSSASNQIPGRPSTVSGPYKKPLSNASYSLGFLFTRQVRSRVSFSAGLQYNYYSTTDKVTRTTNDTMINGVQVSGLYSTLTTTGNVVNVNFKNEYHFITLPIQLNLQFAASPLLLHLQGGIQQLIGSNALSYNLDKGLLYHDKSSLRQTRIYAGLALGYACSIFKTMKVEMGPSFHYGLTGIQKNDLNKTHLYFAGLQIQISPNHKN